MLVKTFLYGKSDCSLKVLTGFTPSKVMFDISIQNGANFGQPFVDFKRLISDFSEYQVRFINFNIESKLVSIELYQ